MLLVRPTLSAILPLTLNHVHMAERGFHEIMDLLSSGKVDLQ